VTSPFGYGTGRDRRSAGTAGKSGANWTRFPAVGFPARPRGRPESGLESPRRPGSGIRGMVFRMVACRLYLRHLPPVLAPRISHSIVNTGWITLVCRWEASDSRRGPRARATNPLKSLNTQYCCAVFFRRLPSKFGSAPRAGARPMCASVSPLGRFKGRRNEQRHKPASGTTAGDKSMWVPSQRRGGMVC
jgi:hypothetical protein